MSWQFWKNKAFRVPSVRESLADIEWPTNAYSSARFLLGMYIKKTQPFSCWQKPDTTFTPEAVQTAEICAQSYALILWFWLVERTSGTIGAQMARDAFLLTAEELDEENNLAGMLDWLMNMHEDAFKAYSKRTEDERKITVNGEKMELPREYFVALHFFLGMQDSPYYLDQTRNNNDDTFALAECLMHVSKIAQDVFEPMQAAFRELDPGSFLK